MKGEKQRRRGRPSLPPEKGKRYPVGIRTTKQLKDLLHAAATASGRSVAGEIEHRLEQSFQTEALYGGPRTAALLRALAGLILTWPDNDGDQWLDDPHAYQQVTDAWATYIEQAKPRPELAAAQARRFREGQDAAERLNLGNYSAPEERERDIALISGLFGDPKIRSAIRAAAAQES
ncbi:MAG: hypothetical protein JO007_04345 [Alphaproteobacteria bacterium]|nr:hypothetical protein [Alphaproteobacteria bacterium]